MSRSSERPIVWDIDGTLTAEPYDETNIEDLKAKDTWVMLALALSHQAPMVVSTARLETLESATRIWLEKNGLHPSMLLMRRVEEDNLPDHIVKERHLEEITRTFREPALWVDDNPGNCAMVRSKGVPCIQVDNE